MKNLAAEIGCWPFPKKNAPKTIYDLAIQRAAARGVLIPLWVPKRLIPEYADCVVEYGEEVAASHVRKLKRELSI